MNANLDIVPAINKIDLPSAHPDEVKTEIEDDLAIPADDAVCVSGKTGEGIHDLLESIVFLISPPEGRCERAAQGTHSGFILRRVSWRRRHGPRL